MKTTVSDLIVRYMERLGIECIFGMPGAHVLPIYDRLHDSDVKTVLVIIGETSTYIFGKGGLQ